MLSGSLAGQEASLFLPRTQDDTGLLAACIPAVLDHSDLAAAWQIRGTEGRHLRHSVPLGECL